jgi:hypothetical protein
MTKKWMKNRMKGAKDFLGFLPKNYLTCHT